MQMLSLLTLLKVLHSPDVNTIYLAECKLPQHCLLLHPPHPTFPHRLSSHHLLTMGKKQLNSRKILLTQIPSMFTPCPQLCCLQNALFSHFIPEFIKWRSQDGRPPSPEDSPPIVMNWNQWSSHSPERTSWQNLDESFQPCQRLSLWTWLLAAPTGYKTCRVACRWG